MKWTIVYWPFFLRPIVDFGRISDWWRKDELVSSCPLLQLGRRALHICIMSFLFLGIYFLHLVILSVNIWYFEGTQSSANRLQCLSCSAVSHVFHTSSSSDHSYPGYPLKKLWNCLQLGWTALPAASCCLPGWYISFATWWKPTMVPFREHLIFLSIFYPNVDLNCNLNSQTLILRIASDFHWAWLICSNICSKSRCILIDSLSYDVAFLPKTEL